MRAFVTGVSLPGRKLVVPRISPFSVVSLSFGRTTDPSGMVKFQRQVPSKGKPDFSSDSAPGATEGRSPNPRAAAASRESCSGFIGCRLRLFSDGSGGRHAEFERDLLLVLVVATAIDH